MTKDETTRLIEDNGLTLHGDIEHFTALVEEYLYAKYLEQPEPKQSGTFSIAAIKAALEAKDEPDKYAMDIECTKCGAKQSGVLTVHTTPPQRKPLTNQQIAEILEHGDVAESNDKVGWYVLPYSFARAIEAAHGIKDNT